MPNIKNVLIKWHKLQFIVSPDAAIVGALCFAYSKNERDLLQQELNLLVNPKINASQKSKKKVPNKFGTF
jgi:hypothetical protein